MVDKVVIAETARDHSHFDAAIANRISANRKSR